MRKNIKGMMAVTLLAGLLATSAHAQMGGGMGGMGGMGGGMGGGGMGGPGGGGGRGGPPEGGEAPSGPRGPKTMKPIARKQFDEAVIGMFQLVDANKDGIVTLTEFDGVIAARRMAVIHNRFARVDANHDGRIDEPEFAAWQNAKGSAAQMEQSFDAVGEIIPDSVGPVLGDKERDMALAMAIEPLNAVVIAKANLNYDTGLSLEELLAHEGARFDKADANHDTYLVREELEALRGPMGGPSGGRGPEGRPGGAPGDKTGGPPPQG